MRFNVLLVLLFLKAESLCQVNNTSHVRKLEVGRGHGGGGGEGRTNTTITTFLHQHSLAEIF